VEVAAVGDRASRIFDLVILSLILLSTVAVVLESVDSIRTQFELEFAVFELFCVLIFTVEYAVRIWSCVEYERFKRPVRGRLRFALRPMLIIDLIAVAPFFLALVGLDMRFVRLLRVFRILRLGKLARYLDALQLMAKVLRRSWDELAVTLLVISVLLVMSATLMYVVEHESQPEVFSDIPATMWWAIVTLTTVGYGDVYPVTMLGKVLASIIAILGIGILALPTAILGSAFVEELQGSRKKRSCPHCGEPLE
jgi:voltage-gated potassium channel